MTKIVSEKLDSVFTAFLNGKKKSTSETYRSGFALWVNFTKMNGKESLEFAKKDTDAKTQELIMSFHKHLLDLGKSPNTAKTLTGALRGFFTKTLRKSLVFIDTEKRTLNEANRVTTDYLFSREDLVKMTEFADLRESYIVKVSKSIGLRSGDFLNLRYGTFRSIHIDDEAPIALGEIVTQKERVKSFPFLDSDAQKICKTILEANPNAKDEDRILDIDEETLTEIIQKLVKKAKIETGSKLVRMHNFRKFLIDRLSANSSESQWKQIVGKKIAESAYVSQDQLRPIFIKVMPEIALNGNGIKKKVEKLDNTVESLVKMLAEKDRVIEELKNQLAQNSNTLNRMLSLPTIEKELRNQKEKVNID